jgi:DNA-directed RNA polymerase specialized sigma24 family protein
MARYYPGDVDLTDDSFDLPAPLLSPRRIVDSQMIVDEWRAILPPELLEVVRRRAEGDTLQEIADGIGRPVATIKGWLDRATRMIRDQADRLAASPATVHLSLLRLLEREEP